MMSLPSGVPLCDGAATVQRNRPPHSEKGAHVGQSGATGDFSSTRKTTDVPTRRQLEILRFIAGNLASIGRPPTYREICGRFHLASTNAANDHVRALLRKGLLTKSRMKARGFVLTEAGLTVIGHARHLCQFCGQSLPGRLDAAASTVPPTHPLPATAPGADTAKAGRFAGPGGLNTDLKTGSAEVANG